jgi:hypothetical protein
MGTMSLSVISFIRKLQLGSVVCDLCLHDEDDDFEVEEVDEIKPVLNVDNIKQVYTFLTANPERHDQSVWTSGEIQTFYNGKPEKHDPIECNTTACLAGWASIFNAPIGTQFNRGDMFFPDGSVRLYEKYGEEVFGFSTSEADRIFYSGNSTVSKRIREVFDDRGIDIPDWLQVDIPYFETCSCSCCA